MTDKDKINTLNKEAWEQAYCEAWEQVDECYRDDPMALTAEIVANEQRLKWAMDIIDNPKYREQAIKASREESARQAKILEQGRIPTVYDDDYVGDDDYEDDECYPDDE